MKFNQNSHELFRKWYVDGRIYFHKVVDSKNIQTGRRYQKHRPLKLRKFETLEKEKDPKTKIED